MRNTSLILVISGPSGSGKDSVVSCLKSNHNFYFSISATTRKPREGEVDGEDYYFLSDEEFNKRINNNEFIEWEEFFNNKYGTLKSEVENALNKGQNCVLIVDVKGAQNIKKYFDNSILVFIAPPSLEELKQRLINRGTETKASIETRMKRIEEEMKYAGNYDHIIINDKLDQAQKELLEIIGKQINS